MKCRCGTEMIMVTTKVRKYPFAFTEEQCREERWHCPGCYLVELYVRPYKEQEPDWVLDVDERLRLLGYIP